MQPSIVGLVGGQVNDLLELTLEPDGGGSQIPWSEARIIIDALAKIYRTAAEDVSVGGLTVARASLELVGAPVAGSVKWRFNLTVSAEFKPDQPGKAQRAAPGGFAKLVEQVGVNAMGGVIAAAVMLVFVGPKAVPKPTTSEERLAAECAGVIKRTSNLSRELVQLANQSPCSSVKLSYQSFPDVEFVERSAGKADAYVSPMKPVSVRLASSKLADVNVDGERRQAFLVSRLDTKALFIALLPDNFVADRTDVVLRQARRLAGTASANVRGRLDREVSDETMRIVRAGALDLVDVGQTEPIDHSD